MQLKLLDIYIYLAKKILRLIENFSPFYFSIVTRDKIFTDQVLDRFDKFSAVDQNFAILMQGPIVKDNDFTIETLRLYRYIYPNIKIVFSTWTGTISASCKSTLEQLDISLLENEYPNNKGVANVNLQIVSTSEGLHWLQSKGIGYVLKLRSDQRIYNNIDFLTYMRALQFMYPIAEKNVKHRLVICSMNSFKYRLYGISDMLMFGAIEDMITYWDVPLDHLAAKTSSDFVDPKYFMKNFFGEGYFVKYFFDVNNFKPDWTYSDSIDFLRDYFVIVDKEQLDLFWIKYNRFFESINILNANDFKYRRRYSYIDWFINFNSKKIK